jgi:hypothetical protein
VKIRMGGWEEMKNQRGKAGKRSVDVGHGEKETSRMEYIVEFAEKCRSRA